MRPLLLLVPALIAATPAPELASVPTDPAAVEKSDDVQFRDGLDGRMTVAVSVGNSGPYRFLVDTGAERTVISRQLADNLQLVGGTRAKVQTVIGTADVSTVDIPALQVSTRRLSVNSAPALDEVHIGADGVLGVDSLDSQRVLFDFKKGIMAISPSSAKHERDDPDTIVVVARRRHGRLLFSNAEIDGRDVVIVIDTGSEITVGNDALRAKLIGRRHDLQQAELISITGEHAMADVINVRSIKIGDLTIGGIDIGFVKAPIFHQLDLDNRPALLLGMNIMRAFDRVSIDFATRSVRFLLPASSSTIPRTLIASR